MRVALPRWLCRSSLISCTFIARITETLTRTKFGGEPLANKFNTVF